MKAILDLKTKKFEEEKKTLEKEIESLKLQNDLLKNKLDASIENSPEYLIFQMENLRHLTIDINNYAKRGFEVQQINNVINSKNRTEFIVLMVKKPT